MKVPVGSLGSGSIGLDLMIKGLEHSERLELGRRRMVGGQQDMIVDVALDLTN